MRVSLETHVCFLQVLPLQSEGGQDIQSIIQSFPTLQTNQISHVRRVLYVVDKSIVSTKLLRDYHKCDVLGNVDHLDCLRLSGGQ